MLKWRYDRLVNSVVKSGKSARAEVVLAEPSATRLSGENTGQVSSGYDMRLRVIPYDGDPFELEVKMEIPILMVPIPGSILQVVYNPKRPQSIVVDPASVPKDTREGVVASVIEIQRVRGGDTTGMQEAGEAFTDPIKAGEAAAAQARSNQVSQRDAMLAEANRIRAEQGEAAARAFIVAQNTATIAQVLGPGGQPWIDAMAAGPPPTAPPPAAARDRGATIEAQLEKLDSLRAAGVLDDEEYAAYRRKLIGN